MKRNQDLTWSQVALAANAPMLIKATMVDGKPEVGILPTGQVTGVIDELPTVAELLDRIETEAARNPEAARMTTSVLTYVRIPNVSQRRRRDLAWI